MTHPFLAAAHPIRWSELAVERVRPDIREGLRLAQERLGAIEALPLDQAGYATVFQALEDSTEELGWGWSLVQHLDGVRNSAELREAINELLPEVTEFFGGIALRPALWERLRAAAEAERQAGLERLHPHQRRHLEETLEEFREAGADLEPEAKIELQAVNQELAGLTQLFGERVLDSTNVWELVVEDEGRLAGLPDSALAAAAQSAAAKGRSGWRFTLHGPSLMAVLQHADDESLREEVWMASTGIGRREGYDNRELVGKILAARQRKAQILGRKDFADLVLARRMAGDGDSAWAFVEGLRERIADAAARDADDLEAFAARRRGGEPCPLDPWSVAYYAEKLRSERYDFDTEKLRPYLPMTSVMAGMFALCEGLFDIRVREVPSAFVAAAEASPAGTVEVWHPEVKAYELRDGGDDRLLGVFYSDWHPREDKRGGAWMNPLQTNDPFGAAATPHIGCICGNMTAPIGDRPALLTHMEVETIFHEFGHLLHHLLGDSRVRGLSGTSVPWDFVELPSQIMENWCWDKPSLDQFARHWESGEAIPQTLFERMERARNFRSGNGFLRQLAFGSLDLDMHRHPEAWIGQDLEATLHQRLPAYQARMSRPGLNPAPGFTHLFGSSTGYAAGYYSYKWAEVLDADAFTRFQRDGLANPATGRAFRDEVLARGNTRPVEESFRAFMGRDPDSAALLARSGLA